MSPFSDRFIDFALPSAPSLKLFNTRTNWDRYFPTAQNRSLANWKRWTLSPTDPYGRLGGMERGKRIRAAPGVRAGGEKTAAFLFCRSDDKCNRVGGTAAGRWNVYGKYMRIISLFGGDNNRQLWRIVPPPSVTPFRTTGGKMMDTAGTGSVAALNPLPPDTTAGLYHCVRAHPYQGGAIDPLGRTVVWMAAASFLFLRTNRVIIPSREEDEAIKHAREGRGFLMRSVVWDAITAPIMRCFIFHPPPPTRLGGICPRFLFPLPHTCGEKQQHVACCAKEKGKIE